MPDFAVAAAIKANGVQFLNTFNAMRSGLRSFGTDAKAAFERAIPGGRALSSVFHSMAGQVAMGNLISRGITAIGHQIRELPRVVEDFASRAQEIGRTAEIIGTTPEQWQRMAYAAKMMDTPVETLQGSMQRLNRNMADLSVGKGTLMDLVKFGPPGLAKQIKATHNTTEAVMLLADAMDKTKDPQVRARIAVAAFGKAGQDMLPFLLAGREELERLKKAADNVILDPAVKSASRFDDALKRMRLTIEGTKDRALAALVDAITPYVEKAGEWLRVHQDLIAARVPEYIDKIKDAGKKLWGVITDVKDIWDKLNGLADGHLAQDILLVVAAWKSVRLFIDLAAAAQTAYNLIAGKIPAPSVAPPIIKPVVETAVGAGAAKWAGRLAGAGAGALATGAGAGLATAGAIFTPIALAAAMPIIDPGRFKNEVSNVVPNMEKTMAAVKKNPLQTALDFVKAIPGLAVGRVPESWNKQGKTMQPEDASFANPANQKIDVNVFLKWIGEHPGAIYAFIAPTFKGAAGPQYAQ